MLNYDIVKKFRTILFLAGATAIIISGSRLFSSRRAESGDPAAPPPPPPGATARTEEFRVAETAREEARQDFIPSPRSDYSRALEKFREKGDNAGYRIVREDGSGLTLEIEIPRHRLGESEAGAEILLASLPGYLSLEEPGQPVLPALAVSVPLPGVYSIEVSAQSSPPRRETGIRLLSSPDERRIGRELEKLGIKNILADQELFSSLSPREQDYYRAMLQYHKEHPPSPEAIPEEVPAEKDAGWYPEKVVESSGPLWAGEEQFVNLRVAPLRYSEAGQTLESRDRVTVEIAFGGAVTSLPGRTETDYGIQFELAASPDSFLAPVTGDGIQVITYGDLADAGFDLGGDPRSLGVYFRGREIAVHVEGEENGAWNPGDYIAFWGEGDPGFYTQTRTYWLYQTSGTGRRMETVSSPRSGRPSRQENFLQQVRLEERVHYRPYSPVGEGNNCWFWDVAGYADTTNIPSNIQFTINGVSDREGMVSFAARYFGLTDLAGFDPDHHTRVYLNGHLLGDFYWKGAVFYDFQTEIPQELLLEGVNTITTVGVDDLGLPSDVIWVDSFDLAYWRDYVSQGDRLLFSASGKGDYRVSGFSGGELELYEVTDPESPRRLTGFTVFSGGGYTLDFRKREAGEKQYWAGTKAAACRPPLSRNLPSDLASPRTVDYIIITHPDFREAVQPLAEHRAGGGLAVETFEVGDIYNTFGFGDFTPEAIQRFLQYAYLEWDAQTRPRYALLVGDGNYDYQNYRGNSPPNYVPPYMLRDPYMETASDNWYACLVGDDRVPDIDIGRFAVNTPAQAEVMVQKTIDYELSAGGLPWQRQVLMVADNPDPAVGNFPADSDWLIANYLPSSFTAQTAYLPSLGLAATRTAILNGMNDGRLLVNYIGHGTENTWSSPFIFRSASIDLLNNADRLHLLVTPTSINGYWCDVAGSCLAEDMTRTAGKGSVAAISPSGTTLNTPARQLTGFLFEELLSEGLPAGTALSRAKARLAGLTPWPYMLDIYTLFGDPALELK